jgi:hypothetical protein
VRQFLLAKAAIFSADINTEIKAMDTHHANLSAEFGNKFKSAFAIWAWVVVFAVAFAWVESAVVVYLRKIFFDGVFRFPLVVKWEDGKHIVDPLVRTEFGREIAAAIMIAAVSWVSGKNRIQRFCFFMVAAFCWDWKNIIQIPGDIKRTGIPNPFAWWLFLPAYLCSIVYFVVMMRRIISGR